MHSQKPDLSDEILASQGRSFCCSRLPADEQPDVCRQKQFAYTESTAGSNVIFMHPGSGSGARRELSVPVKAPSSLSRFCSEMSGEAGEELAAGK